MKIAKQDIVDTLIDLYSKYGIPNISIEQIADTVKTAKSSVYHHFKGAKDEIVDNIIMIFDEMIRYNTPNRTECIDINSDARNVLFKLFFVIRVKVSEKLRKINRIIFSDQHYNQRIQNYMLKNIYEKRELGLLKCFSLLMQHGKVEASNTQASRMLNRIYICLAHIILANLPHCG